MVTLLMIHRAITNNFSQFITILSHIPTWGTFLGERSQRNSIQDILHGLSVPFCELTPQSEALVLQSYVCSMVIIFDINDIKCDSNLHIECWIVQRTSIWFEHTTLLPESIILELSGGFSTKYPDKKISVLKDYV